LEKKGFYLSVRVLHFPDDVFGVIIDELFGITWSTIDDAALILPVAVSQNLFTYPTAQATVVVRFPTSGDLLHGKDRLAACCTLVAHLDLLASALCNICSSNLYSISFSDFVLDCQLR